MLTLALLLTGAMLAPGQNLLDEQGRKTGPWREEFPNGRTLYEAHFQEGRPVGEMIRYYESGAVRARMMFDSLEDRSFTRLYYKTGKLAAKGWYVEKLKDSIWTYYSEYDGSIRIKEPYQHGEMHGIVRSYYPSGVVSEEVNWQHNKKDGAWKRFYEDGSLRLESRYENDLLNGTYEVYRSDSTLQVKGFYLDNLSHGTWSFYDEEGSETVSVEYQHGKAVDQEKYLQIMQDSLERYLEIPELDSMQHF